MQNNIAEGLCVCLYVHVCVCVLNSVLPWGLTDTLNVETLCDLLETIITWLGFGSSDPTRTPDNDGLRLP